MQIIIQEQPDDNNGLYALLTHTWVSCLHLCKMNTNCFHLCLVKCYTHSARK